MGTHTIRVCYLSSNMKGTGNNFTPTKYRDIGLDELTSVIGEVNQCEQARNKSNGAHFSDPIDLQLAKKHAYV